MIMNMQTAKANIRNQSQQIKEISEGLSNLGINIWLAGGWGVAGLEGRALRAYEDIDWVIVSRNIYSRP